MRRPPTEQPFNPKHRMTGAVILIGVAIVIISLLLGDPEQISEPRSDMQAQDDSFVSRIVTREEAATPPQSRPKEVERVAGEGDSMVLPRSDDSPLFDVQPVLKQEYRLSAPRLNTVNPEERSRAPAVRLEPIERLEPVVAAGARDWVLQVISLADKGKADQVADRLRQGGYEVTSTTTDVNGRPMTRVRVGPWAERLEAVRAKADISERFGLNGFVFRQE